MALTNPVLINPLKQNASKSHNSSGQVMIKTNRFPYSCERQTRVTPHTGGQVRQLLCALIMTLIILQWDYAFAAEQSDTFPQSPDNGLQELLNKSLEALDLSQIIAKNKLSVTLVDITDIDQPVMGRSPSGQCNPG